MDTPIYDQLLSEVDFDPEVIGTRVLWNYRDAKLKCDVQQTLLRAARKATPIAKKGPSQ